MEDLIEQLSSLGETLAEHLTVVLYLSSLPDSYGTLITALETRPAEDLTKELVKTMLLEEYTRRKKAGISQPDVKQKALKAKDARSASTNSGITCFFCKKLNHVKMKKECRKYIEWKKQNPTYEAKTVTAKNSGRGQPR